MGKTHKFVSFMLCMVMILSLIYIPSNSINAATKTKINKKTATIHVGKTVQLKVTGTKKKVAWSSSNKKIATVTSKGKVKGVKKGKATITAKVNKNKYTCKVTVKKKVTTTPKPTKTETPKITPTPKPSVKPTATPTLAPATPTPPPFVIIPTPMQTLVPSPAIQNTNPPITSSPIVTTTNQPTVIITASPIPTQKPVVTLGAIECCNIGESYTSRNGFSVCLESISSEQVGTNYLCKITYSINNDTDEILDSPIFRVFDDKGNVYTQYGVFNKIYPGVSINKTYTFSITNNYHPIILELVTNIRESYTTYYNTLNPNELHWIVP